MSRLNKIEGKINPQSQAGIMADQMTEEDIFGQLSEDEIKYILALKQKGENIKAAQVNDKAPKYIQDALQEQPKVEDLHTRRTYLIRNDLIERMDKLMEGRGRGAATRFVNRALAYFIERAEKEIIEAEEED